MLGRIEDRIGDLAARLVEHVLNVDVARGNDLEKPVEHAGPVAVDEAQAVLSEPVERRIREIDAVSDVAVAEIVHDLARGHDRALFLRLRRRGAEMREAHDIFLSDELRTSSPRAKFKMRMPGFIFANVSAFR